MNLLFVIHSPRNEKTAVYKGYLNKKFAFEKHGWTVDILSPQDFAFSANSGRFMPLVYPFQVARWLHKTKVPFDLVVFHSYCGWVFHILKKIITRRKKIFKTATTFHGVEELFFRAMVEEGNHSGHPVSLRFRIFYCYFLVQMIKFSCKHSDKIFCLNRREKKFLEDAEYQTPDNISIRPNDIQSDFFIQRTYNPAAKTLLFVGQWLPMKGTRYLIDAFKQLSEIHPQLKLILAGTLKSRLEVLKEFPEQLHSKIEVLSEIVHEEMIEHYHRADIFILPSLFEAFNRALVEAMASGLPAISTSVGIVDDCLTDGLEYLKIPFRDSLSIVQAVSALAGDTKRREQMGLAAQKAVEVFREDRALEICFQGYYELMTEPSR